MAAVLLLMMPYLANAVTPGGSSSVLVITQTVTGPTEGVVSSVSARQGTPQNAKSAMTLDVGGRKLSSTSGIPEMAVVNYGTAMTRSQLTQAAKNHIVGLAYPSAPGAEDALVAGLKTYMQAMSASAVAFTFNQKVKIAGDAAPKYLIWSLLLQRGQDPAFPNPQVIDQVPTILQVTYTPRNVAAGLPSSWAYPNAGTLQWRKLDSAYSPITGWSIVDVAGAYDQPQDLSGAAVDKDWGLKCLVNRASSATCPTGINVIDLMDQVGAGYAMLDYGRTLQPVYDSVETPPGSGQYQQVAHVSLSVDTRELNTAGCASGTFTNKGTYGFQLRSQVDRYAVLGDGSYRQLNSFAGNNLSPTAPFDVTKSGLTNATIANLNDKIIDISTPSNPLLLASSIPNLLNLAPITVVSTAAPTQVIGVYYYGDCGRSFGITAQCDANGNIQMRLGISGQVPNCAWGTGFYQAQAYSLKVGVPVTSHTTSLEYAGSFAWSYDGDHAITFKHTDDLSSLGSGAPLSMSIFAAQMFFPNQGYFVKQNFPSGGPLDFYFEKGVCAGGTVGGDAIFTSDADGYGTLATQCFKPDPMGTFYGCLLASGGSSCDWYRVVSNKAWIPSQN